MSDTVWIVIGAVVVVVILGLLYLKHQASTASVLTTVGTDAASIQAKVAAAVKAELAKVEGYFTTAPTATAPPPPPVVPPPAIPTATPAGAVPTKEQVATLEAATAKFHAAHAELATAAKAVAGS